MLNDTQIKHAKSKDRQYRLSDGNGLNILITPKGKKTWVYRYRFNGKENTATLGHYPAVSLLEARLKRAEARELLVQGIDPNAHHKQQKISSSISIGSSFNDMFNQWFELNKESWKPNYQQDLIKRSKKHLSPYIGNRNVSEITSQEMLGVFKVIESAGTIDTLHKVKGCASRVFRYCVGLGIIEHDPTRDLPNEIFKRKKVTHLAHITDPQAIGGLLRMIDEYQGTYQIENALKIAPYLFLRPGELAGLEWNEVDLKDKLIRINAKRMKMKTTHLVPLCPQVISLLENLKNIKTGSNFVFPSLRSSTRHISPESLRAGLRRMGISNEEMTTHGFRHMASTRLYELGYKGDVIERQLAHGERNKIKAAYNHAEHLKERRIMMNEWADYLDKLKNT
jgi:integrase